MSASIQTLSAILKEFYLGPIEEQLNNETMVIDLFEKATVDWQGKNVIVPIHVSRNTGVGFKSEADTFAAAAIAAGSQGYKRLVIEAKFLYGRFQLSGPAIASAKTGSNSFATYIEAEINKLVTDVRNTSNFSSVTGGPTIGLCWTKGNAAIKEYSGQSTGLNALGGATDTAQLVLVRTAEAVGAATQVNAVTEKSITFNAAINTAIGALDAGGNAIVAGDVFSVELPAASTVKNDGGTTEVSGIMHNLFSGSHFTVARNTETELISTAFTVNKGDVYAALNLDSIQSILDEMLLRADEEPTVMLMNPVMRVEYTSLLQGVGAANLYKDLTGAKNGDAGFTSLGYAGIPMKVTRHAPKGQIMFLCPKYWRLLELDKKGFADLDGSILSRVAGAGATDAYEGFYKWYYEVVCHRPNANAVLCAVDF
jgi:hypothetical protein